MRIITLLLVLTPFFSFGQRSGVYEVNKLTDGTGVIEEYGKPLWGYSYNHTDTSQHGKLTVIVEYKNHRRNGRRIQFFNYPYDTASVERYTNDTLDGAYYYNHTNGKLWTRGVYRMGWYEAAPEYWTEDGQKLNENITWSESSRQYFLDGKVCSGKILFYGKGGPWNGKLKDIVWFTNGKIDSLYSFQWAYWGKSAEVRRNYLDSTRTFTLYGSPGKVKWHYSFKIDSINVSVYMDGNQLMVRDLDKVSMHGKSLHFHDNSEIVSEEFYFDRGVRVGEWKYFDTTGKLVNTVKY